MSARPKVKPRPIAIPPLDGAGRQKELQPGGHMSNEKPLTKAGDFPQEVLKLFDQYVFTT